MIEAGGATVYDSGDTVVYDGLLTSLRRWRLDLALLPIKGRDAERYRRGCIGNMTYQEAVDHPPRRLPVGQHLVSTASLRNRDRDS